MSSRTIPIAIILGGIIIAGAVYFSIPRPAEPVPEAAAEIRPVDSRDHVFGNPSAPVMVIEYADFYCEYCKDFDSTMHKIIASEGTNGEVAWVFRNFPLTEIHPNALSAAKAGECVADVSGNEAFWKFKDEIYKKYPVLPQDFGNLAKAAGADTAAFATCYASESAAKPLVDRIQADRQNALQIGAQGTPYSVILVNGKVFSVIDGAYPYESVKQVIDQIPANF